LGEITVNFQGRYNLRACMCTKPLPLCYATVNFTGPGPVTNRRGLHYTIRTVPPAPLHVKPSLCNHTRQPPRSVMDSIDVLPAPPLSSSDDN